MEPGSLHTPTHRREVGGFGAVRNWLFLVGEFDSASLSLCSSCVELFQFEG